MIGFIQRLLQILVIVVVGYFIWRPQTAPVQVRPIFQHGQRFVFGETVSWSGFAATWNNRWQYVTGYLPGLTRWAKSIPSEPPQITSESIADFFTKTLLQKPMQKWEVIKQEAGQLPISASPSATP